MEHYISTLVENKPGVLQKVTGLFTRRGFNIEGITVGDSEVEGLARMVITVKADDKILEQVINHSHGIVLRAGVRLENGKCEPWAFRIGLLIHSILISKFNILELLSFSLNYFTYFCFRIVLN